MVADPSGIFCTKMDGIVYRYEGLDTFNKILKQSDEIEDEEPIMEI